MTHRSYDTLLSSRRVGPLRLLVTSRPRWGRIAYSSAWAYFHWLGQKPLARGNQSRFVYYRRGSLLILQHQSQVFNRLGDVFFEFGARLIDEGMVLRLGLGDPHFYVRCAICPILKGMSHHNLWRARDRKKGVHGKIVGRTPIQHLFDDSVLSVHAMILSANSPTFFA
jgi:hypothetical protein